MSFFLRAFARIHRLAVRIPLSPPEPGNAPSAASAAIDVPKSARPALCTISSDCPMPFCFFVSLSFSLSLLPSLPLSFSHSLTCVIFVHLLVRRHSSASTLLAAPTITKHRHCTTRTITRTTRRRRRGRRRASDSPLRAVFEIRSTTSMIYHGDSLLSFGVAPLLLLPFTTLSKHRRNASLRAGEISACCDSVYLF